MYVEKTYAIELLPTKEDEDIYEYTTYIVHRWLGKFFGRLCSRKVTTPVKLWPNVVLIDFELYCKSIKIYI